MFKFFKKRSKRMKLDDIMNAVGELADEEKQQLLASLEGATDPPQEPVNEAEPDAEEPAPSEPAEPAPTPQEPVEVDPPADDTLATFAARMEAQDTALSTLTERLDTILSRLEDKDFGAPAAPPSGNNTEPSDDEVMRRYNPRYRG